MWWGRKEKLVEHLIFSWYLPSFLKMMDFLLQAEHVVAEMLQLRTLYIYLNISNYMCTKNMSYRDIYIMKSKNFKSGYYCRVDARSGFPAELESRVMKYSSS